MENSIIEKLDQHRTSVLKLFTAGFGLWYGATILSGVVHQSAANFIITCVGLMGWVLWAIALIKIFRLRREIRKSNVVKNALMNELFIHNRDKSFIVGFWTLLSTVGIFLIISIFYELPTVIVCKITLYLGVLSTLIAATLYNRE